ITVMNKVSVRRIVTLPGEESELPKALLEVLDIDSIMRERTEHLSRSKVVLEKQANRTRAIVRFVKDVAVVNTIDRFMNLLKSEIKPFQHVKEPVLAYVNSQQEPRLVFFQGAQIYERSAPSVWPPAKGVRVNDVKDS